MGGSSLCPEVLRMTFGKIKGFPVLHVLDSTDPAQIKAIEAQVDLKSTICIVSSKSGSTLEPNIYKQYFFEQIKKKVGAKEAGNRFIAITDPGSKMQQVAEADKFRHIFFGVPSIGGRYSALSNFGMIPAAVMGLDVAKFLKNAQEMVKACGASVAADKNPGVLLGAILGTAAKEGADKVTIISSPGISDLGAWLEQLIAESTGKQGKGIIPVDREKLAKPEAYGNDRVFAYLRLETKPDKKQDAAVAALEKDGLPVVRIKVKNTYNLGQEFFRWEIATAVAGAIIGINAFNQPDVEASKIETRKLTSEYESTGKLPPESPFFEAEGLKFYADPKNVAALSGAATLRDLMKLHLDRINAGDYFGVLAYITMNEANEGALQVIRHKVRDAKKVATVLGFGPRFLHSTGQAYKGGPDTGVFLQITCDDKIDFPVPGQKYTFGVVKAAQARGDFAVLAERGRRALRVHIGKNVKTDLAKLSKAVQKALA
jgi:transaldolase/glucose-6-phosphate isomerase